MSSRNKLPAALLAALEESIVERGGRREGREVRFRCPAHDDHEPSARWNPEKAVWHCDACGAGGGARDLAKRLHVELPGAREAAGETAFAVRDASGRPVAEHVRIDPPNGKRRFIWRRNGRSGLDGLKSTDLPLYGAEHIAGFDTSRPVFVVEGEKAAESLRAIGAQAVGTVTGANVTPGAAPLGVLTGFAVVLWPDFDSAGVEHTKRIAAALQHVAASVRTFVPAGLPESGDAAEWIAIQTAEGKAAALVLSDLERLAAEDLGVIPELRAGFDPQFQPAGVRPAPLAAPESLAAVRPCTFAFEVTAAGAGGRVAVSSEVRRQRM